MDERRYCSRLALDEPLAGTADPVDVWLLLEYRPIWNGKALLENDLAEDVRGWFDGLPEKIAALGLKARPQFVRQPEIDSDRVRLLIAHRDALFEFSGDGYAELMAVDVARVVAEPQRFADARLAEPRYFVCTNGQRDLCCARFGLPVYQRLRNRVGERTWQATHLGGHRFAANVLVMPEAVLYGRVDEAAVDDLLDATEAGRLHFPMLRGRHRFSPPAQAAEAHLVETYGADAATIAEERESAAGVWEIVFRFDTRRAKLEVQRDHAPRLTLKSCADADAKPVVSYRVTSCQLLD